MKTTRRTFIQGCGGLAIAGAAGAKASAWFDPLVASGAKGGLQHDVLVYLFLRGGIDGLHLVVPYAGPDRTAYESARGNLAIPEERLRRIGSSNWGWHPRAGGTVTDGIGSSPKWLQKLFNDNRLAVIHATGMSDVVNRSHFDCQAYIELGTPGTTGTSSGWLARYLQNDSSMPTPVVAPAIGFSGNVQTSLIGANDAISIPNGQAFRVDDFHWSWNETNNDIAGHQGAHTRLFPLWDGDSPLERAGRATAEALGYMRDIDFGLRTGDNPDGYQPGGGAVYPTNHGSGLGTQLRNLAQLIKLDAGLVTAAVDYGFWDTHEGQGMPNPGDANQYDQFGNLTEGLASALHAFYTDLNAAGMMDRVTVVIQSEFGRRFRPNASSGTDHGYGNVMMALGNRVNGGFHGTFPGLDGSSLFEGEDVDVTTDFRHVLGEVMTKRMGLASNRLGTVFPGYGALGSYGLNVFQA